MGKYSARGGVFVCKLCPPVIPVRQRTPNNFLLCHLLHSFFYIPLVYKREKKNRCKFSSKITSFEDWLDRKWDYPVNETNRSRLRPAIREGQLLFDQREGFRFDTPPGALLSVDFKAVLSTLLPAGDGIVHDTADLPQLLLLWLR